MRGQIKGQCRVIFLILPGKEPGQYIYIAREGGFFDPHFDLYDAAKETCNYIYIVELVTFTCGMEFCILTIIKNTITFIVADIYE